jgi:hypothetical protein
VLELFTVAGERLADGKGRLHGAQRMVLEGDRGTEESHETVAKELVDRSLITMDGFRH